MTRAVRSVEMQAGSKGYRSVDVMVARRVDRKDILKERSLV